MRSHGTLKSDDDANAAAHEALRGVAVGAARWSVPSLLLSGIGQFMSPIYRGLTIQFKVFLVMGGMLMGGWIEGDRRLRRYENWVRARRQLARDEAMWREFEVQEERVRLKHLREQQQQEHSRDRDVDRLQEQGRESVRER